MVDPKDPPEELDIPDNQEQADDESVQNLMDWLVYDQDTDNS